MNYKKLVCLLLILCMSSPLASCRTADSVKDEEKPPADLTVYVLEGRDAATQGISNVESSVRQSAATFEDETGLTVEVSTGIPANSGVTADDAQRALNASILAGEGPDVIVLDGLPIERMAAQGMLLDLSSTQEQLTDEGAPYENILAGLGPASPYAIPSSFSLSVIAGDQGLLNGFESLEELAQLISTDASYAQAIGVNGSLHELFVAFYPRFIHDNSLDKEALASFLQSARTMLDAAQANYDQRFPDAPWDLVDSSITNITRPSSGFSSCDLFLDEGTRIQLSSLDSWSSFGSLYLNKDHASYPFAFRSCREGESVAFVPLGMLGINASSPKREEAERFIAHTLSTQAQKNIQGLGIPLSETACDELTDSWDGGYSIGFTNEDGSTEDYSRGPLTPDEVAFCKELIASADTAALPDRVVTEAVAASLKDYCRDALTLDEATSHAAQKIDLYLKQ